MELTRLLASNLNFSSFFTTSAFRERIACDSKVIWYCLVILVRFLPHRCRRRSARRRTATAQSAVRLWIEGLGKRSNRKKCWSLSSTMFPSRKLLNSSQLRAQRPSQSALHGLDSSNLSGGEAATFSRSVYCCLDLQQGIAAKLKVSPTIIQKIPSVQSN